MKCTLLTPRECLPIKADQIPKSWKSDRVLVSYYQCIIYICYWCTIDRMKLSADKGPKNWLIQEKANQLNYHMLNHHYYIHFRNPSSLRPPRQQYIDPATLGTKKGSIVLNTPIYPVSQGTWNILHHKTHIKCLCDIKFLLICLKAKRTKMDIS